MAPTTTTDFAKKIMVDALKKKHTALNTKFAKQQAEFNRQVDAIQAQLNELGEK